MTTRVPVAFRHHAAFGGFALFVAAATLQAQGADSIRVRTSVSLHGDRGRMDVRDLTRSGTQLPNRLGNRMIM
jgi:hypothetical protein